MKHIPEAYKAREEAIAAQSFYHTMHAQNWQDLQAQIAGVSPAMVRRALSHAGQGDIEDTLPRANGCSEPSAHPTPFRQSNGALRTSLPLQCMF